MPSILLPRPYSQKPPLGAGIDWSNPLAQGLLALVLLNEAGGSALHSLVGPVPATPSGVDWTATELGPAFWWGSNVFAAIGFGVDLGYQPTSFTVASLIRSYVGQQQYSRDAHGRYNNNGNPTWHGTLAASGFQTILYDSTQATHTATAPTASDFATDGRFHLLASAWDGQTITSYADTASGATAFSGALYTAAGNYPNTLISNNCGYPGQNQNQYDALQAATVLFAIWSRALSAAEVQTLYTQPYALLQPQRRLWSISAGGSRAWSGSGSVIEAPTAASSRLFVAARAGTVTEQAAVTAARMQAAQRAQSATVSPSPLSSHLLSLIRASSVATATSMAATRATVMGRTAATTLSSSLSAARSAIMSRSAVVTATPTVTASRLQAALRTAGATISAIISDTSSLQHAGSLVYSVAITIAPTVANSRALVMGRAQSITSSATVLGSRLTTSLRAGTTALSPTVTASRAAQALRTGSSTLTTGTGTARLLSLLRASGSTLVVNPVSSHLLSLLRASGSAVTATSTTTRAMTLLRTSTSRITALTSALGSGSFSPPLVQIAAWAASRARRGIEELVLAYQSIQSHLGHTQDTASNFDAGFATFSGETVAPPNFPDATPGVPQIELPLDLWVAARVAPGSYDLITAFATRQRLAHNLQATFATYDSLYATFVASQENVPWPR